MNRPAYKVRLGKLEVAIWEGNYGFSVSVQKSGKRKDGSWDRSTIFITPAESAQLIGMLAGIQPKLAVMAERPREQSPTQPTSEAYPPQEAPYDDDIPF